MSCPEPSDGLPRLIRPEQMRWIERHLLGQDIPFVVIGGVAVRFHVPARTTEDVDLLIEPDPCSIDRMLSRVRGLPSIPTVRAALLDPGIGHMRVGPPLSIDLLTFAPELDFATALRTSTTHRVGGNELPILSQALLIRHKIAVGEPKDLEDVSILRKAAMI